MLFSGDEYQLFDAKYIKELSFNLEEFHVFKPTSK